MRVLVITNQVKRYMNGHKVVIESLLELGHEVHWAANFDAFVGDPDAIPCAIYSIPIQRNPLKPANGNAFRRLLKIIDEQNIDAVVCSTPIGGLLGRLAAAVKRVRCVLYTAHGFTFYKGAPWWWNLIFKAEELALAPLTDVLITINNEDMAAARTLPVRRRGHLYQISGAGIDENYQCQKSREEMRRELQLPQDALVFVSAGALNKNKNYAVPVKAFSQARLDNAYYLLCGEGFLKDALLRQIEEQNASDHIRLLGYRTDVLEIMGAADIMISSSLREGLPRVTMEAMDLGLPCVVSNIRGNADLIEPEKGGFLCDPRRADQFAEAFTRLAKAPDQRAAMGRHNKTVVRRYTMPIVYEQTKQIYRKELHL